MARVLRSLTLRRALFASEVLKSEASGSFLQLRCFAAKGKKTSRKADSDSGEDASSKKELALQEALDQISDAFGKGTIMWLGRSAMPREVPVISTGSFSLDLALGIGGLPKGRIVEIYGPEASGKTTLALHVIAEAQKHGGYCVFVDAEHALDPALAEAIGVRTDKLLISQPDCGEQALSVVDTIIRSGSVDVVVLDSVAALVPKTELDGVIGDTHVALQARLMSQALRKLTHSLSLSQTILIFTNQVRAKVSTTFSFGGPMEVTSGGNALKFYSSVRLNIKRVGTVKKGEEVVGSQVLVKVVKNKNAPPFKTASFEIEFGKGIALWFELLELGLKHKFISRAGAYYFIGDEKFLGKEAVRRHLEQNEDVRLDLMMKLREKIIQPPPKQVADDEELDGEEEVVATSDNTTEAEIALG